MTTVYEYDEMEFDFIFANVPIRCYSSNTEGMYNVRSYKLVHARIQRGRGPDPHPGKSQKYRVS